MKTPKTTALIVGALIVAGTSVSVVSDTSFARDRGAYSEDGMRGHHGRHGRGGHVAARLMEWYDTNNDGQITQAEIDAVQAERFATANTNGGNGISLDEFQTLWLRDMRERMVDRFQALDANGDGTVTEEEFNRRSARLMRRLDRNGDGVLSRQDRPRRDDRGPRHQRGGAADDN